MSIPQQRENLKRRDWLRDLSVDGRIILKRIPKIQCSILWAIFCVHWPRFLYTIMKFRVSKSTGNLVTSWAPVSFSRAYKIIFLVLAKPGDPRLRNHCPNLNSSCAIWHSARNVVILGGEHVPADPGSPICQSDLTCDITGSTSTFCVNH
jgi:hypothetical protein